MENNDKKIINSKEWMKGEHKEQRTSGLNRRIEEDDRFKYN